MIRTLSSVISEHWSLESSRAKMNLVVGNGYWNRQKEATYSSYWSAHRFDEAVAALEKAVEFDSESALAHAFLGCISMYTSRYERAIEEMQGGQLSHGASAVVASLGEVYAAAGGRDEAQRILKKVHQLSRHQYVSSYPVARTYMALGEKEEAFHWLKKAYAEHSAMMMLVRVDPRFSELHFEPRFEDLLRRMNFPDKRGFVRTSKDGNLLTLDFPMFSGVCCLQRKGQCLSDNKP